MERIKRYNQILYALLGSTAAIILLAMGLVLVWDVLSTPTPPEHTLIVPDELDSLKALNLRSQIISLEGITSFDTATSTYLIPVYHKMLSDPASRDTKIMRLEEISKYQGYYHTGHYNNLILYNFEFNTSRVLVDQRINIDGFNMFKSDKRALIVFTGWINDTNEDKVLDGQDFKEIYVYDHASEVVNRVKNVEYQIISYQYLDKIDQLIIKVTHLPEYTEYKDEKPEFLVTYSFKDNTLKPLIGLETLNNLQDIIDN